MPADQAAMLPALVLGDTSALSADTTAQFRAAGLTHLTAVSGANVTIVCGAVLLIAVLVGPRTAVVLAGAALVAFVIVVQPSASVLRAAVMAAITLLALVTHRRRQAIPVLSATVIALMIAAPELAVDVGFALSVSATAALVVIAPRWSRRLVTRGWPKPLADAVCVAFAAQLVTAPLVAAISGTFSVVAALANLAVAVVIRPDHRHRHRGGRAVGVLACGRGAIDPVHRTRAVVVVERGPLGGGHSRRICARSRRAARRTYRRSGRGRGRHPVAVVPEVAVSAA